jgi:hypothetical protein
MSLASYFKIDNLSSNEIIILPNNFNQKLEILDRDNNM